MRGNTLSLVQHFDHGAGQSHVQLHFGKLEQARVIVASHFDVIVDIDPGLQPLGVLVRLCGKRPHGGVVEAVKLRAAGF